MRTLLFILIAIAGGILGAALFSMASQSQMVGATVARTTITNPWTFSTSTTFSKTVAVTSTNTATSTVKGGCFQLANGASSTGSQMRLAVSANKISASTTFSGTAQYAVYAEFGTCPNL